MTDPRSHTDRKTTTMKDIRAGRSLTFDFDTWFLKKPGKTGFSGRQNRRTTTDSQQGPDFAKHYKACYTSPVFASFASCFTGSARTWNFSGGLRPSTLKAS